MNRIQDLARLLDRHTATLGPGIHETVIERVALVRQERPSEQMHTVYSPLICIVAQGAKRSIAGSSALAYGPGQYLAVSVDMPVIGEVVAASPSSPYLCLKLDLDRTQLSDLLLDARLPTDLEEQPDLGLSVSLLTPEMLDAATRLVGLLDKPWAVGTLGPLYERELLYFLLAGPQGGRLREMALAEGRTAQIVKAVRWIRARFREAIAVEDAAAIAGMSPLELPRALQGCHGAQPPAVPEAAPPPGGAAAHGVGGERCGQRGLRGRLFEPPAVQPRVRPPVRRSAPA